MKKYTNRIIFLTQYYPPETGAPQNRISDLAQRFQKAGFDVRVLTAKPNYPIGKIYPGFEKGFLRQTVQEGISVTHCAIHASNKNLFHRLVNYFSFVFSSMIVGLFKIPKADILIVESPPLFLSISAWFLSRMKNARLILNISDLYPETAISLGILKNNLLIKIFYYLESWVYRVAAVISCQTKGIAHSIQKRFSDKLIFLLTNGVDFDKFVSINNDERIKGNDFLIGYAGVIGYAQGIRNLIEPTKRLLDFPQIQFFFYGDGPERESLTAKTQAASLSNVKFLGHYPYSDILNLMQTWDVGLVPLADIPLMAGALPSKMFEMMAMQLPILLIAPEGEASILIKTAQAGIWVKPDSDESITEAILKLYNNPALCKELGINAQNYVKENFNRQQIFSNFLSFLREQKLLK